MSQQTIDVLIRVRPSLSNNITNLSASTNLGNDNANSTVATDEDNPTKICVSRLKNKGQAEFTFSHVYGPSADQVALYDGCNVISHVLDGINCCIMTYGQTNTGKTYTMYGSGWEDNALMPPTSSDKSSVTSQRLLASSPLPSVRESVGNDMNESLCDSGDENSVTSLTHRTALPTARSVEDGQGIIPRCITELFDSLNEKDEDESFEYTIHLQMLQIYNEKIYDLLQDKKRQHPLPLRETGARHRSNNSSGGGSGHGNVQVQGISIYPIMTKEEAFKLIRKAIKNKVIRATEFNAVSSRAHTVLQLFVTTETTTPSQLRLVKKSVLTLVDLAGSEKWRASLSVSGIPTPATDPGNEVKEMTNINTSLHVLGNCVAGLLDPERKHIPFRDSVLTRLLQPALTGQGKCILVATIHSDEPYLEETYSTLQFASRASKVKVQLLANVSATGNLMGSTSSADTGLTQALYEAQSTIQSLTAQVKDLQTQMQLQEQQGHGQEQEQRVQNEHKYKLEEVERWRTAHSQVVEENAQLVHQVGRLEDEVKALREELLAFKAMNTSNTNSSGSIGSGGKGKKKKAHKAHHLQQEEEEQTEIHYDQVVQMAAGNDNHSMQSSIQQSAVPQQQQQLSFQSHYQHNNMSMSMNNNLLSGNNLVMDDSNNSTNNTNNTSPYRPANTINTYQMLSGSTVGMSNVGMGLAAAATSSSAASSSSVCRKHGLEACVLCNMFGGNSNTTTTTAANNNNSNVISSSNTFSFTPLKPQFPSQPLNQQSALLPSSSFTSSSFATPSVVATNNNSNALYSQQPSYSFTNNTLNNNTNTMNNSIHNSMNKSNNYLGYIPIEEDVMLQSPVQSANTKSNNTNNNTNNFSYNFNNTLTTNTNNTNTTNTNTTTNTSYHTNSPSIQEKLHHIKQQVFPSNHHNAYAEEGGGEGEEEVDWKHNKCNVHELMNCLLCASKRNTSNPYQHQSLAAPPPPLQMPLPSLEISNKHTVQQTAGGSAAYISTLDSNELAQPFTFSSTSYGQQNNSHNTGYNSGYSGYNSMQYPPRNAINNNNNTANYNSSGNKASYNSIITSSQQGIGYDANNSYSSGGYGEKEDWLEDSADNPSNYYPRHNHNPNNPNKPSSSSSSNSASRFRELKGIPCNPNNSNNNNYANSSHNANGSKTLAKAQDSLYPRSSSSPLPVNTNSILPQSITGTSNNNGNGNGGVLPSLHPSKPHSTSATYQPAPLVPPLPLPDNTTTTNTTHNTGNIATANNNYQYQWSKQPVIVQPAGKITYEEDEGDEGEGEEEDETDDLFAHQGAHLGTHHGTADHTAGTGTGTVPSRKKKKVKKGTGEKKKKKLTSVTAGGMGVMANAAAVAVYGAPRPNTGGNNPKSLRRK